MARPIKRGLDYFPLDTALDDKFRIVEALHGLEGFGIVIHLLQRIYSEGYFYKWGEMELILFSNSISADRNKVQDVVSDCIKYELFSSELMEQYGILTSRGIQTRYLSATSKRSEIPMIQNYLLIDVSDNAKVSLDVVSTSGNPTSSVVSTGESTQSKVKESKVNKTKVTSDKSEHLDLESIVNLYHTLCPKLPVIKALNDRRKKTIKSWGNMDEITEVFTKAGKSDFLNGDNDRGWTANIDWLIKPENRIKVLEVRYENRKGKNNVTTFNDYEQRTTTYDEKDFMV